MKHVWNALIDREKSTPGWKEAHAFACNALTLAVEAGARAANRDEAANEKAEEALKSLQERLGLCFHRGV